MDRQLLNNLKKIYIGIVVYDFVVAIILILVKKFSIEYVGGLVVGSLVAMLALYMMARNIESIVDSTKNSARIFAGLGYMFRVFLYGAVLVFAAITKHINVYTVAVGLISTNIVIKIQQLVLKKNKGKED